tara:strand:+ start:96 stop:401 length:306 start_codon:yes stop_codon:yes gene_type:complete
MKFYDNELSYGATSRQNIIEMITNPKDKEKLESAIKEISNSMTLIDAQRDHQKSVIEVVAEDTGVEKKFIRQLASLYHKQSFAKVQTEREEMESIYEQLFG